MSITPNEENSEKIIENIKNLSNNNKIPFTNLGKDNDETFNRLLEIQLLIKKESGLKELCKYI
jgi:hypothetical protein